MNMQTDIVDPNEKRNDWKENLSKLTRGGGFYRDLGPMHNAVFVRRGTTLVVTFENLDDSRQDVNRVPWGMDMMLAKNRSCLGLMSHAPTWYRDEHVYAFFNEMRDTGFFEQFENVVFYGASMGGYAATAFSAACPGAHVIAVSPQATLDRNVTGGWETRYRKVWKQDFRSQYGSGHIMSKSARKVTILFDPAVHQDAMHASLYSGPNVTKLRFRHCGHGLLTSLRNIGVVGKMINGFLEETLTEQQAYALFTQRKKSHYYQKRVLEYLLRKGRHNLIEMHCAAVIRDSAPRRRPHFENAWIDARTHQNKPADLTILAEVAT